MEYWSEGSRAFAFWDEDEYFYPATIVTIEGDDIFIRFETSEEVVAAHCESGVIAMPVIWSV